MRTSVVAITIYSQLGTIQVTIVQLNEEYYNLVYTSVKGDPFCIHTVNYVDIFSVVELVYILPHHCP